MFNPDERLSGYFVQDVSLTKKYLCSGFVIVGFGRLEGINNHGAVAQLGERRVRNA
jgi:hypothetical protein